MSWLNVAKSINQQRMQILPTLTFNHHHNHCHQFNSNVFNSHSLSSTKCLVWHFRRSLRFLTFDNRTLNICIEPSLEFSGSMEKSKWKKVPRNSEWMQVWQFRSSTRFLSFVGQKLKICVESSLEVKGTMKEAMWQIFYKSFLSLSLSPSFLLALIMGNAASSLKVLMFIW